MSIVSHDLLEDQNVEVPAVEEMESENPIRRRIFREKRETDFSPAKLRIVDFRVLLSLSLCVSCVVKVRA